MYRILDNLRIVECASFIAGPIGTLHLQQLGVDVIRIDPIGGGPDFHRWPLSPEGASLYWEGLNKGKKSIALDLARPEGRDLALRIAAAPGEDSGILVTNYPLRGFLSHERLAALRPDQISVRVMGWPDGRQAVDYTINSAVGVPLMTGPADVDRPVNHVLPAWDLSTGAHAALLVLAAERKRRATGEGAEIRLSLADVAMATLGNLGQIGEVAIGGEDRPRIGNDLFGAFGRDFATSDGHRIMIVAITPRQWEALVRALSLGEAVARLEAEHGVSFASDGGLRFNHRDRLFPLVEAELARRELAELARAFDREGVCWGPYQPLSAAVRDARLTRDNPLFATIEQASGYRYPTPGSPAMLVGSDRDPPRRAPRLGEHTDEVLAAFLGLPEREIAQLHDDGIVAGAPA